MLVHAGTYMDRRQIKNTDNTQTKHNPLPQKAINQNIAKQIYPGSVASYDTRPGNEMGLSTMLPSSHGSGLLMTLAHVVRSTITVNN